MVMISVTQINLYFLLGHKSVTILTFFLKRLGQDAVNKMTRQTIPQLTNFISQYAANIMRTTQRG